MCTLCQAQTPQFENTDTHVATSLVDGGVAASYTDNSTNGPKPFYSNDQIADYLTDGFWGDTGRGGRSFDVETGGTITYNINGLDSLGKAAALDAMASWTAVSGLQFQASNNAMMTFDDNQSGAYNSSVTSGDTIISSSINVSTQWRQYGDYYLQTYIHEIGHAIGLGHTGDYNGSASYSSDAHFANDSWQSSVMSYFDQNQNTSVDASRLFLATAQLADIVAVQNLYGTATTVRTGDTVYGDGENTGQFGMDLPSNKVVAILDNGGTDHINLGSRSANQVLNLNAETYSDLNGYTGNFSIARGTVIENATTGSGNDLVTGNGAANVISTGAGDDTIFGNGGDDVLIGGLGADLLTGGSGADTFTYAALSEGGDTVTDFTLEDGDRLDITSLLAAVGYSGTDPVADGVVSLEAGSGGSWLVVDNTGDGSGATTPIAFLSGISASTAVADIIDVETGGGGGGGGGGDVGTGSDTTYTYTDTYADGWTTARGFLNDLDGGTDTIDVSSVTTAVRIYLDSSKVGRLAGKKFEVVESTEIENILMGNGRDTGVGNAAENMLDGGGGADRLYGLGGADLLLGGEGSDRLYGGEANDLLDGGLDADRLYGDEGDDDLTGGDGKDRLYGGDGNDILDGGEADDYLYGGLGDDAMTSGLGNDRIYGHAGNDTVTAGEGNDRVYGGDGDDEMSAGDGNDTMEGDDGNDMITGGAGRDRIKGEDGDDLIYGGADADMLYGGDGNDIITGADGNDRLYGDRGDDNLSSGAGNDYIYSGTGNDTLSSGDDDDRLYAGTGDDLIMAGSGNDRLYGDRGSDTLDGGAGRDSLYGGTESDVLFGGEGDDVIYAHAGDDWIEGGDGADRILADRGQDNITGGAGNDDINAGTDDDRVYGNDGDDEIDGGSGDDLLDGGAGMDEIVGGTGDDVLTGGAGIDRLSGGTGYDAFVFSDIANAGDTIRDFNVRHDTINLSELLQGLNTTVADAIANETLTLESFGRGAMLRIDTDGFETGEDPFDIVYLERFDEDTVLTEVWLI